MLLLSPPSQAIFVGQVITHSVTVPNGIYRLSTSKDFQKPVLTIRGADITVDFSKATLEGSSMDTPPDARQGLALLIDGGRNITIKNAHIRGYKLAVLARKSVGLKLINCDWSYNWKQHLKSTIERENESDWMSFHHNEHDEWINGTKDEPAYGAGGVYVTECRDFKVLNCHATGSQCGLMLNKSDHGEIIGNDFSFLSAVGIGLYRSSDNQIIQNNCDYCVRGYSHGVYSRGQDSAGFLVYEQSNRNIFAYNSAVYGGDGFFLWAGQSTMDTGKGGCNDNLIYGNDFSHSPANGIEATFSRNVFVANRLVECWHGVWGGYSYDSKFLANALAFDGQGFAIEHGQNNLLDTNDIEACDVGIALFARPETDPTWGYPKHRDTRSMGNLIQHNRFILGRGLSAQETSDSAVVNNLFHCPSGAVDAGNSQLRFSGNTILSGNVVGLGEAWKSSNSVEGKEGPDSEDAPLMTRNGNNILDRDPSPKGMLYGEGNPQAYAFATNWDPFVRDPLPPHISQTLANRRYEMLSLEKVFAPTPRLAHLTASATPFVGAHPPAVPELGRRYILVDEWGPFDFRRPLLWRRESTKGEEATVVPLEVLGPKGRWRLVKIEGGSTTAQEGEVPGALRVTTQPGKVIDLNLQLEYVGGEVVDAYGHSNAAGKPVKFSYKMFSLPVQWRVNWYRWTKEADPRIDRRKFEKVLQEQPIKSLSTDVLAFAGSGAMAAGLPADHYATVAEGIFDAPAGKYRFELTTDDGCEVWFDGKAVFHNAWKYQAPTTYSAVIDVAPGPHHIRLEHFQIDGYAQLRLDIKKG